MCVCVCTCSAYGKHHLNGVEEEEHDKQRHGGSNGQKQRLCGVYGLNTCEDTCVREDVELAFIIQQMIWVVLINATVYIPSFNRHVCKPSARCLCPGY